MTTDQILAAIPKLSALVVGDICLDRWCTYDPALSETSRETGLPRTGVISTSVSPGAGGTVASNLVALNVSRAGVLGVIGDDGHGFELMRALEERGIEAELMIKAPGVPTFTYTKLINAATEREDLPRVDFLNDRPLTDELERKLLHRLVSSVGGYDVVLIADQAETDSGGVITRAVREKIAELAGRARKKVFWADSRKRVEQFRGVVAKPNREEADAACMRLFGEVDYERLRRHIGSAFLVVTQGEAGAILVEPGRATHIATTPVAHPVDICGAGDSFSAGAALALAVSGNPAASVRFGNLVASITIMKRGTGTASPEEVLAAAEVGT